MRTACVQTDVVFADPTANAARAAAALRDLKPQGVDLAVFPEAFLTGYCYETLEVALSKAVPIEAGIAIVLWIGVIITAQAFQATPLRHAPAVAVGLFPAIAAWGATVVAGAFIVAAPAVSNLRS